MNNRASEDILNGLITAALRRDALDEISDAPSSDELREAYPFEKKHSRLLRRYKRLEKRAEKTTSAALTYFKRAAVIVMAVVSLTFALMMTDTDIRAAFEHAVIEFFDKYASIRFNSGNAESTDSRSGRLSEYEVTYVPEGFEMTDCDIQDDSKNIYYSNDKGEYISILLLFTENTQSDVDTEQTVMEEITAGEFSGYINYNEQEKFGDIIAENDGITLALGGYLSREELVAVAEGIRRIDESTRMISELEVTYLPEGYELTQSIENPETFPTQKIYFYTNENSGDMMTVIMEKNEESEIHADTEYSTLEEITIGDFKGYLHYNETENDGSVIFENNGVKLFVSGPLDREELVAVAEGIRRIDERLKMISEFEITYIPDGYELIESIENPEVYPEMRMYTYSNSDGECISFGFALTEIYQADVDTEYSEMEEITVGEFTGFINYSDFQNTGAIILENNGVEFDVDGNVSREELIKIAEGVKY